MEACGANVSRCSRLRTIRLTCGWVLGSLVAATPLALRSHFPPWVIMWLLTGIIFIVFKVLTLLAIEKPLSPDCALAYLFLWPGMRPQAFGRLRGDSDDRGWCRLGLSGVGNLFVGVALLMLSFHLGQHSWVRAWLWMSAFSFLVHFGLFDLLSAWWRRCGVRVEKLFVSPVGARSLGEFWGQRWNRAFSSFAFDRIFRPLAPVLGGSGATLAVFLFSGLVHELVISVPAGAGHGGPTLYFFIQGLGTHGEKIPALKRWFRKHAFLARICTGVVVLAPLPLLFHEPFLHAVVLPLMARMGG